MRFWGDPRIDPLFDFFIKAEMLMSQVVCHRSKQMVVGRCNAWRVRRVGETSHFSVSKYVLTGLAKCGGVLSCWRITLSCLSWYCSHFSRGTIHWKNQWFSILIIDSESVSHRQICQNHMGNQLDSVKCQRLILKVWKPRSSVRFGRVTGNHSESLRFCARSSELNRVSLRSLEINALKLV